MRASPKDVGYLFTYFHLLMFTETFFIEENEARRACVGCPEADT